MTLEESQRAVTVAMSKTIRKVVREVTEATIKELTPGTPQYLNAQLVQIEKRRKDQLTTTESLRRERQRWADCLKSNHHPVRWERRQELAGYFQDNDMLWPQGCPIVTLTMA